jgi:5-methylcytosine-specific restriction endonuclease McrA
MKNATTATPVNRTERNQGSKWIRQEKRLAIYLRDGLACAYCGHGIESGATLSLDHVVCHSHGGSNDATNLVTCCTRCNSSRGTRSVETFAKSVAAYVNHSVKASTIIKHVRETIERPIDVKAAKALIAQRGSYSSVLNS